MPEKILIIGHPDATTMRKLVELRQGVEIIQVESKDDLPEDVQTAISSTSSNTATPASFFQLDQIKLTADFSPKTPSKRQKAKDRRRGARHY